MPSDDREPAAATETGGSIDVPPHPRLLSVLGDIEFQPWQCIAELIDNAFDDFLRSDRGSDSPGDVTGERPTVWVTLPARASTPRDAEVWVKDNGSGMTLEQLTDALRAGWTSNDRYGSLGLFGVGFNIATARLGHVAVVRTSRVEDPVWQVVTIDLRKVAAGADFRLPVTTELKTSQGDHGTEVVIRELKPEHHETLSHQQNRIKLTLGDVYSYLLSERDFRLIVDTEQVKPRRACVWGEDRAVVRSGERIPAVIHIDETLADRLACLDCGTWQDSTAEGVCVNCRSPRLRVEHRRIWGWLGVQRYLHKSDWGIDFIRNGRKILIRDVSMFQWVDPDDPASRGELEYPMEVPAGAGRLVGEIHIDHVRVNYQKNAFEYETPEWKRVERLLRGEGPILPKRSRELGYPTNRSPIARLVAGYRRNVPGLNYLIPGDGKNALHDKAQQWATLFRKGDPKYKTDNEWYEAARQHDEPPAPPEPGPGPEAGDILGNKGLLPDPNPPAPAPAPAAPETEDDRRARWRSGATSLPDLEGSFGLRGQGAALDVTAWLVHGHAIKREDGEVVPVYVGAGRGAAVEVFIDADHAIFTDFGVDTRDLVLVELADYLRVRNKLHQRSLSALFAALKDECLPDHRLAGPFITDHATRLLTRVRELMQPVVAGSPVGYWTLVTPDDQAATQSRFALEGGYASWDDLLGSGGWVDHAPGSALVRLLTGRPESFLDGRVFRAPYGTLTDGEAQKVSADRIIDLLSDVAVLADRPTRRSPEELQRGRLSCRILELELAPAPDEDLVP